MPSTEKIERVAELKRRIESSTALLLTEYRGLTVAEISELRRSLSASETSFAVIKNTLMARAAGDAGIEDLQALLAGPSAVAFVSGDPVAAAKQIKAAAKSYPALVLKGGYMDGAVLDQVSANRLADLESREVMLSKIAGLLKVEMSRAAAVFVGVQSKFLSTLEAYRAKVPGEAPEPAATEAEPTEDEAPGAEQASVREEPETTDQSTEEE